MSACMPCPAGTYGLNLAASSISICAPCSAGEYSAKTGAASFTTCRQCPAGTYSTKGGSSNCTSCPEGSASSVVGSSSSEDCLSCDPGSFANATGQTSCDRCAAGSYQGQRGQSSCIRCSAGSSSATSGMKQCILCEPGSFASVSGLAACEPCPPGTLQLEHGGTFCSQCPAIYQDLPAAMAVYLAVDVCSPLSRAVVVNWGPVGTPGLLAANVTIVEAFPTWLSSRVTEDTVVTFSTDLVPPNAAELGDLNISLAVTHTCRSASLPPWNGFVSFTFVRSDPAFIRDPNVGTTNTLEACPDFVLQYTAVLGSCSAQTVVAAMLSNGSSLPSFVTWAYGSGVLEITGTVPPGTPTFEVVAVALLGSETFVSLPTKIVLAASTALQILSSSSSNGGVVRACPFVQVSFSVVRQNACGKLRLSVLQVDGSQLPSYLIFAVNENDQLSASVTVFGVVPENAPTTRIFVSAVAGGQTTNSTPIDITRPALVNFNVAVTMTIRGGQNSSSNGTSASNLESTIATSLSSMPYRVRAPYGETVHIVTSIDFNVSSSTSCSPLSLILTSSPPPQSATAANAMQQNPFLALPTWISVIIISESSLLISAMPTSDVGPGSEVVVFLWANDGLHFPGFNLTFAAEPSLMFAFSAIASASLPVVVTPASLVELSIRVVLSSNSSSPSLFPDVVLICPSGSSAAAFCSFNSQSQSLGAFGTPAGINDVIHSLRVSVAQTSLSSSSSASLTVANRLMSEMGGGVSPSTGATNNSGSLQITVTESVNPSPLSIQLPASRFAQYVSVAQARPLLINAKVGIPFSIMLSLFFRFDPEAANVVYSLISSSASLVNDTATTMWLSIDGSSLRGTPPISSAMTSVNFTLLVADKFTKVTSTGSVDVSWPLPPVIAHPLLLNAWHVASSSQIDIQLPVDVMTDPQNGTLTYELRSSDLQRLPSFLSFDGHQMRLSGTPQASDVGTVPLVLIGRNQYGLWEGNATATMTITVAQSWSDFFAWVYALVGYCASGVAAVTWCLVYRATIINILLFKSKLRKSPPAELLCLGRYALQDPSSSNSASSQPPSKSRRSHSSKSLLDDKIELDGMEEGINAQSYTSSSRLLCSSEVKAVRVTWIEQPIAPFSIFPSAYLSMHRRLFTSKMKSDPGNTGVVWMKATPTRSGTVELVLEKDALKQLVDCGQVALEDEFYVEIVGTGLWRSGTVIDAFVLRVYDVEGVVPPLLLAQPSGEAMPVEEAVLPVEQQLKEIETCQQVSDHRHLLSIVEEMRSLQMTAEAQAAEIEELRSLLESSGLAGGDDPSNIYPKGGRTSNVKPKRSVAVPKDPYTGDPAQLLLKHHPEGSVEAVDEPALLAAEGSLPVTGVEL